MRGGSKSLLLLSLFFIVAATCAARVQPVAAQANWPAFWTKFKTAVVKGNKQAVLSLSESTQLPKDYTALFGTRAKKQCFAKAKPVKDEQGGYSVFCGEQGYYFKKVDGQFRFTESFAND